MKYLIILLVILFLSMAPVWGQELTPIGATHWSGYKCVLADEHYIYCGSVVGMMVMDASDISAPTPISRLCIDGGVYQISVKDNFTYTHNYGPEFRIFDISDRLNPFQVSSYTVPIQVRNFHIYGEYAFLSARNSIQILDISDPYNPALAGHFDPVGYGNCIHTSDGYAYFGDSDFLKILDVNDVTNPTLISTTQIPSWVVSVFVDGQHAFVGWLDAGEFWEEMGIQIYNVSDPSNPILVGEYEESSYWRGPIVLEGDYIYIATEYNGMRIIDISDPASPELVGIYGSGWIRGISVWGANVFLVENRSGPFILNISDPTEPTFESAFDSESGDPYRIFVSGRYAYISNYGSRNGVYSSFQIVDLQNPFFPFIISNLETPSRIDGIFVNDSYAYLAEREEGLQIIDIGVPSDPVNVGFVDTPDIALDVTVSGDYAFVADNYAGLQVISIHPGEPMEVVGNVSTGGSVQSVSLVGPYAYVADGSRYIWIINISQPTNPYIQTSFTYGTGSPNVLQIRTADNLAVASLSAGIWILDISNPTLPVHMASYPAYWSAGRVAICGDYVSLIEYDRVVAIDISDPYNPEFIDDHFFGSGIGAEFSDVTCDMSNIFVGNIYAFAIYDFTQTDIYYPTPEQPYSFSLSQNYPNPFNAATTIKYALPEEAEVTIEIYDILGRRIETLVTGKQPAGSHSVVWEAKDVPSGVYFYRIEAGEHSQTQKCVLLK